MIWYASDKAIRSEAITQQPLASLHQVSHTHALIASAVQQPSSPDSLAHRSRRHANPSQPVAARPTPGQRGNGIRMMGLCAGSATSRALEGTLALRHMPLFQGAGDHELAEIAAAARRAAYARGAVICPHDGTRDDIVLLARGMVALRGSAEDGEDIFFGFVRAGETFGITPCEARVLTAGTVAYHVPHPLLRRLMATTPAVNDYVHALLCRRLGQAGALIVALTRYDTPTRLARLLAQLAEVDGEALALTQADLGAYVGARQECVSLALAALRAQGLVEHRRGVIIVRDRARLAAYPGVAPAGAGMPRGDAWADTRTGSVGAGSRPRGAGVPEYLST